MLCVLELIEHLAIIAKEDAVGQRIQDDALSHRKGAPLRKAQEAAIVT